MAYKLKNLTNAEANEILASDKNWKMRIKNSICRHAGGRQSHSKTL